MEHTCVSPDRDMSHNRGLGKWPRRRGAGRFRGKRSVQQESCVKVTEEGVHAPWSTQNTVLLDALQCFSSFHSSLFFSFSSWLPRPLPGPFLSAGQSTTVISFLVSAVVFHVLLLYSHLFAPLGKEFCHLRGFCSPERSYDVNHHKAKNIVCAIKFGLKMRSIQGTFFRKTTTSGHPRREVLQPQQNILGASKCDCERKRVLRVGLWVLCFQCLHPPGQDPGTSTDRIDLGNQWVDKSVVLASAWSPLFPCKHLSFAQRVFSSAQGCRLRGKCRDLGSLRRDWGCTFSCEVQGQVWKEGSSLSSC